jgi:molybdopterin/thiamine biosynthesis adenylyltransferase/proteasome lid subunit RPN8/RPN11
MTEIVFPSPTFDRLLLLKDRTERGAAIYLEQDAASGRYLVRQCEIAEGSDVLSVSASEITFAPQFLTRTTRRARENGQSLALLHTHPSGVRNFSATDDRTEQDLASFMRTRNPGKETFSMVLCDGRLIGRHFGEGREVGVRVVGSSIDLPRQTEGVSGSALRYDRQVRAFGSDGQAVLSGLTVAIVGLGGTGSVVAQQLAHLGVGAFVLVDPDKVDDTNLNRVVGSSHRSVGMEKIRVAQDLIHQIRHDALVDSYCGSVISETACRLLRSADCIFMATDSHSSRAFLSELSFQYLIPAFDLGVSINARDGAIQAMTGRTQMVAPGLPCLLCSNVLDARRIREELLTPEQRAADPYFNEGAVAQPAVISLNSTMVSLAVTMFLGAFAGIPGRARWQSYDGIAGTIRTLTATCDPDCFVCGSSGIAGAGDARHLSFLPHGAA